MNRPRRSTPPPGAAGGNTARRNLDSSAAGTCSDSPSNAIRCSGGGTGRASLASRKYQLPGSRPARLGVVDAHHAVAVGSDEHDRHHGFPVAGADERNHPQPTGVAAGHVQAELGLPVPSQHAPLARVHQPQGRPPRPPPVAARAAAIRSRTARSTGPGPKRTRALLWHRFVFHYCQRSAYSLFQVRCSCPSCSMNWEGVTLISLLEDALPIVALALVL